uniref:IBB domain-containing protein n=1 Tax=Anas platyrhynchos platyrhynchos TaxID=8840 RepID=A0A493TW75_ANAPP
GAGGVAGPFPVPGGGAEELRARRREREAALRKARRQEQLVSKRLLREDEQDGAEVLLQPLPEDEVREGQENVAETPPPGSAGQGDSAEVCQVSLRCCGPAAVCLRAGGSR